MKKRKFFNKKRIAIIVLILPLIPPVISIIGSVMDLFSESNKNKIYISSTNKNEHGIGIGDINNNSGEITINNNVEQNLDNKEEIIMSESKYMEYLSAHVNGEILFHHYNDYDGDGSCEMFALIGQQISDEISEDDIENIKGKVWYVNQKGISEIESKDIIYYKPKVFSMGQKVFISFEEYHSTGCLSFIWGVRDNKPYQPNISGKGYGISQANYDEIMITDNKYDGSYDKNFEQMMGHTWKEYYFYFNGKSFREYGGIAIDVNDLLRIPDCKQIVDGIYRNKYIIDSIYYRQNGVININISKETDDFIKYYNVSIRCHDGRWDYIETENGYKYNTGIYEAAMIASDADYPDKFPY